MQNEHLNNDPTVVELPRPTAWPMVMALGVTLILAGMVTNIAVAILGLLLTVSGIVGWFFEVLPHEAHEAIPLSGEEIKSISGLTLLDRERPHLESGSPRQILPVETFRLTTGIRGGIAGGIAMILPATLY